MLRSLKDLKGYSLDSVDGAMGSVRDVLFDDQAWIVRYLVAATGPWLLGHRVLIGWESLGSPDWERSRFPVSLTREQVKRAPSIDTDAPVSRRHEKALIEHYGWTTYWPPLTPVPDKSEKESPDATHVRSANEVIGYHIEATDGSIGHVDDLIADDESWVIRYLVVDTKNWLPGRKVLVSPVWTHDIEWRLHSVTVGHTKEEIENSPPFDPSAPVNREYEARLYDYYGRPAYWDGDSTIPRAARRNA